MKIREATRADARQIVGIFHDTIHTVNTQDYTTEQVKAWSPAVPDADEWAEGKLPTRTTFVADDDGTIAGFGELENNGHVDCFYCHRAYQRRGVGSAIYCRIEDKARILGLTSLFTEASITAKPFFAAMGFTVLKQQTVICRGVELTNFVMEKALTATKPRMRLRNPRRAWFPQRMKADVEMMSTFRRIRLGSVLIAVIVSLGCSTTIPGTKALWSDAFAAYLYYVHFGNMSNPGQQTEGEFDGKA